MSEKFSVNEFKELSEELKNKELDSKDIEFVERIMERVETNLQSCNDQPMVINELWTRLFFMLNKVIWTAKPKQ